MKKIFLSGLCALMALVAQAQNFMVVEKNDNSTIQISVDDIKRVHFEAYDMHEDLYTIGNTDYSTPWWSQFSKDYQVADGQLWRAQFDLHINPYAINTWANFALIITNDEVRGSNSNYREYGALRFDHQPSGNSEWGDYIDRSYVTSTLTFQDDMDGRVQQLGGRVTLTVDRTNPQAFTVTISNGIVTKTYSQPYAMPNLNTDAQNTNMRFFIVPERSYIDFLASNIEPVGGYTSSADKQPLSMTLSNVPTRVLIGSSLEQAMANVTACVQFEENVSRQVTAADLQFSVSPDMTTPGVKTLTATYAKTYHGEAAQQAVSATATFTVIADSYTTIGATDYSTPFWGAHSDAIKVRPNETFVSTFTNYTSGANIWNNFVIVLHAADNSEYACLRADNYGWGSGYENNPNLQTGPGLSDWQAWLAAMNGAKVTAYVTNNGDGTADINFDMLGNDGKQYQQYYKGITINADDFYFHYTVEGCFIEFNDQVGASDNSSQFWSQHSSKYNVPEGKTVTRRFKNSAGAQNWNNFILTLTKADQTEYACLRADNYGWGNCYDSCTPVCNHSDWPTWLQAMDGAMCTVSVTNNGTTADVRCVMQGTNGTTYTQDYIGLSPIEADNLYMGFTIDSNNIVFE